MIGAEKFEKTENAIFWFSHIFHFLEKLINFGKFWFLHFLKKTKNKRFLTENCERSLCFETPKITKTKTRYEGENYECTIKCHATPIHDVTRPGHLGNWTDD